MTMTRKKFLNGNGIFYSGLRKGMKVQIPKWVSGMKHRKNRNGIIVKVDGAYIYVRPMWCKHVIELYPNELKVVK